MEAHARAPDPLTNDGDMASNWQSWKEDFIIFMKVTGYINKSNEIRANLLKNRIGKIGIDAIKNMSFDRPEDKDDMDILIAKLETLFNPPKNEVVERYQFFTKSKKQNESMEQYINNLKEKAKSCNFKEMTDSIIRDKIILETHDKILRKKLFDIDNLDLQKLVVIYNDYKINTEKMKQVTQENIAESGSSTQKAYIKKGCWRCGRPHAIGKCPAMGSKCTKCGEMNHFTHCCKNFKSSTKINNDKGNLLNPKQQQKTMSKSNEKLWNNNASSTAETKDAMIRMNSLPDIPTAPFDVACSASSSDFTSDFIVLNACNTNSSTYSNTMSQSAYLPKNTQYNYSNISGIRPEWITDIHNKNKRTQSKTTPASTFQNSNKFSNVPHNASNKFKPNRNKKSDEDTCVLS